MALNARWAVSEAETWIPDSAMASDAPQIQEHSEIATNLAKVHARIEAAAKESGPAGGEMGRPAPSVTLIAVSKAQPEAAVRAALAAGHREFGENRVQEAQAKWPGLKATWPEVELHLIGPLQTNKVPDAVALFDVIETVDRPKLARAVAAEMGRSGRRPQCYIQVNTGEEPQKSGIPPDDADHFIEYCRDELALPVVGLMCMPPIDEEPALHFALLREIAGRHGLGVLSMGMSGDFEIAVRFGATHVRVGSAIFGPRQVQAVSRQSEAV